MASQGQAERSQGGLGWLRAVLVGLVLGRGLVGLCLLPPFEGWDEYQHVGAIQYLLEKGRAPVLGEARVPEAVVAAAVRFPGPEGAVSQLRPQGARGYATYWVFGGTARPRAESDAGAIPLYQAQQGSFYYRIAAPLFAAAGGAADPRTSLAALRVMNLLLLAAAVWIALGAVETLVPNPAHAGLIGLLIATQPLFLINGLRVANDALGVLLATVAVAACLTLNGRNLLARSAALGLVVGLAILAKSVHFGLVPFVAVCGILVVWRDRVLPSRAAVAAALLILGLAVAWQPEARENLANYGLLTPMQEALKNQEDGRSAGDLLATARGMDWGRRIDRLWTEGSLLTGGWSFLMPDRGLIKRYRLAVLGCLLGWFWAIVSRGRRGIAVFRTPWEPVLCVVLCGSYTAALGYHMVQSQAAWGQVTTNPWYAAVTLPWFSALLVGGGLAWPLGRLRPVLPGLVLAACLTAEVVVTWGLMVPTYSGGAGGWEALGRLASLQPPALGTPTLLMATALEVGLLALAVVGWVRLWRRSDEGQGLVRLGRDWLRTRWVLTPRRLLPSAARIEALGATLRATLPKS